MDNSMSLCLPRNKSTAVSLVAVSYAAAATALSAVPIIIREISGAIEPTNKQAACARAPTICVLLRACGIAA